MYDKRNRWCCSRWASQRRTISLYTSNRRLHIKRTQRCETKRAYGCSRVFATEGSPVTPKLVIIISEDLMNVLLSYVHHQREVAELCLCYLLEQQHRHNAIELVESGALIFWYEGID